MIIDIISDVCASLSKRMDQQINYIYVFVGRIVDHVEVTQL